MLKPDDPDRLTTLNDLAVAGEGYLIVHIDAGADVVGDDGEHIAHGERARLIRFGDIEIAVLLVQPEERERGIFHHVAVLLTRASQRTPTRLSAVKTASSTMATIMPRPDRTCLWAS